MKTARTNENHLHEYEPRWFAVYTRYKREKLVLKRLQEQGIHACVPLQRLSRRYDRKVKTVELPLISCYVFARITRKQYVPVLSTADVQHFVHFSHNLIAIPDREIQILQRVAGEGLEMEVEPKTMLPGEEVEIVSGSLAGIHGILVQKDRKKNVVIELNGIGFALRISVDPALLRRVKHGNAMPAYAGARG